ncbi:MAG: hypothetical protein AAGJ31_13205 [Verrucomicrobiota bacterium]
MKDTSRIEAPGRSSEPHFYREFLAERDEILKNKWVLSEDAGKDVGFDVALIDWVTNHREKWIAARNDRLRESA